MKVVEIGKATRIDLNDKLLLHFQFLDGCSFLLYNSIFLRSFLQHTLKVFPFLCECHQLLALIRWRFKFG